MSDEVKQPVSESDTSPHPNTPKNIDWVAAQQYYLESFTRTYLEVAKKFKVSLTLVEQHGSDEDWVKTRKELGEKALQEFEANKIYEIAQVNSKHLRVFRGLLSVATKHLFVLQNAKVIKTSDLKNIADTCEKAVNGERLIFGLPTRVSKSEIMGKLTTDLQLSPEHMAKMDKFFKDETPK